MDELNRLHVAALTSGRNVPSARFRVRQHVPFLREEGIEVREHVPLFNKYASLAWRHPLVPSVVKPIVAHMLRQACLVTRLPGVRASRNADVTWLERELVPGVLSIEDRIRGPIVFDVDDAIWAHPVARHEDLARLARQARLVIAGNEFIAEWFRPHAVQVEVVPTAVDTGRFAPGVTRASDRPLRIGWTGTSSNFGYLRMIEPVLRTFVESNDAVLVVVADAPPRLPSIPPDKVVFERWTEGGEADAVRRFDIGLMPLIDDVWGRGKCGYKALQYMACGVPAIVSSVGFNQQLVDTGGAVAADRPQEWLIHLERLSANPEARREIGLAGRKAVEARFSCEVVSKRIAVLLREAASDRSSKR